MPSSPKPSQESILGGCGFESRPLTVAQVNRSITRFYLILPRKLKTGARFLGRHTGFESSLLTGIQGQKSTTVTFHNLLQTSSLWEEPSSFLYRTIMNSSYISEPKESLATPKAVAIQAAEMQALTDRRRDPEPRTASYVLNPSDQSVAIDHKGQPISVDRILATKPLKSDLHSRRGPGGRSLVYYNGETVSRLLNDIFGYDGWNMNVLKVERICCVQEKEKWQVGYMAHVRITHRASGTFKEDMGSGDCTDKHMPTAVQNSVKGAITDALKRAARHFGEKLGNSLYSDGFSMNSCPKSLTEALDQYDRTQASKFPSQQKPIPDAKCLLAESEHPHYTSKSNNAPSAPPLQNVQAAAPSVPPRQEDLHAQVAARGSNFHHPQPQKQSYRDLISMGNENKRPNTAVISATTVHHQPPPAANTVSQAPESSYGHRSVYKKAKTNPYA